MGRFRILLALLPVLLCCGGGGGEPVNLLLISIDTLRADHLGAYGYHRPTSPALDELAAAGVVFESVISPAPWTLPAHVSMLASLYPSTHRVTVEGATIDPATPTLATILQERGFATAAFVDHVFVSSLYGFDRGFDRFDERGGGVAAITRRAIEWLGEADRRPFFLFLHLFDVHCPYVPPPGYRDRFRTEGSIPFDLSGKCGNPHFNSMDLAPGQVAHLVDQYDGGIAHVDARLGLLFSELRAAGLWDDTLIAVTSDHGEEFLEHGQIGHERTVYDEVLRVPWILRVPGGAPRRIAETVRLIDLAPTALDLLGVPPPGTFQGRSLAGRMAGSPEEPPPAFAELDRHLRKRSIHRGGYHLLRDDSDPGRPAFELYAWRTDRAERRDLFGTERGADVAADLARRLEEIETAARRAGESYRPGNLEGLSEARRRALEEKLRSLGYLP